MNTNTLKPKFKKKTFTAIGDNDSDMSGVNANPVVYEEVNHPTHYQFPNGVEVADITDYLSFNRGNAVKYAARSGRKPAAEDIKDLKKAIWYLQREIDLLNEATPKMTR